MEYLLKWECQIDVYLECGHYKQLNKDKEMSTHKYISEVSLLLASTSNTQNSCDTHLEMNNINKLEYVMKNNGSV